jgi:predicted kinase
MSKGKKHICTKKAIGSIRINQPLASRHISLIIIYVIALSIWIKKKSILLHFYKKYKYKINMEWSKTILNNLDEKKIMRQVRSKMIMNHHQKAKINRQREEPNKKKGKN